MIKQPITTDYLNVLTNGVWETWVKDSAINPAERLIVAYKGKRYDAETRVSVKRKDLIDRGFRLKQKPNRKSCEE